MADFLQDKKLTQDQADELQASMELDLISLFKVIEADMIDTIDGYEGTPEDFINEIISTLNNNIGSEEPIQKAMEGKQMPGCKPKSGESEKDFMSRCIPLAIKEGKDQKEASGKCYGIYREAKKKLDV